MSSRPKCHLCSVGSIDVLRLEDCEGCAALFQVFFDAHMPCFGFPLVPFHMQGLYRICIICTRWSHKDVVLGTVLQWAHSLDVCVQSLKGQSGMLQMLHPEVFCLSSEPPHLIHECLASAEMLEDFELPWICWSVVGMFLSSFHYCHRPHQRSLMGSRSLM